MSSSTVGSESFGGGAKPVSEGARNMTETLRNIHENYRCAYVIEKEGFSSPVRRERGEIDRLAAAIGS
jgi:hypothetical protein